MKEKYVFLRRANKNSKTSRVLRTVLFMSIIYTEKETIDCKWNAIWHSGCHSNADSSYDMFWGNFENDEISIIVMVKLQQ